MNNSTARQIRTLSLVTFIATVPGIAYAQLRATSDSSTYYFPNVHDVQTAAVGTPKVEAKTKALAFGADAQSVMQVAPSGPDQGSISGNAHSCAGTGGVEPSTCGAMASGKGTFDSFLRLSSATLPIGTPVDIEFQYRAKVKPNFKVDPVYDYLTISADLFISAQAAGQSATARGSYGFQSILGGGAGPPKTTGIFGGDQIATLRLIGIPVGSQINFSAELNLLTGAYAYGFYYNSADIKAGVIWGADALNPEASLFYGPSDTPFPSRSNVNEPNLDAAIPDFQFPPDHGIVTSAPEPGSLFLLGLGGMLILTRRRKAMWGSQRS